MASVSYKHSILYKGDAAKETFEPKNRAKAAAKTLRHRPGAEPAFFRKDLEEKEKREEEERRKRREQQRDDKKYRGSTSNISVFRSFFAWLFLHGYFFSDHVEVKQSY